MTKLTAAERKVFKERILGEENILNIGPSIQHLYHKAINSEKDFNPIYKEYHDALTTLANDPYALEELYDLIESLDDFVTEQASPGMGVHVSSRMSFLYKGMTYELCIFQVEYIRFIKSIHPYKPLSS